MDKISRFIIKLLSLTIILLALVVIGLRISLANIDLFKSDIESWLASNVAPGISYTSIQGGWNQFNPIIKLNNASIMLPDRRQTTAVDEMSVEFDIWKSLRIRSPVVREVSGTISKLSLTKDSSQQWWLNEISLGGASLEKTEANIEQLIARIPHYLHLELDRLIIFDQASDETYQINNIEIDAQQRDGSYYLQLNANLPDVLGNRLSVRSVVSPENSVGYLKSDRLELDRLASLFGINIGGIKQAKLSGEVWLNFLNNQTLAMNGNVSIKQGLFQSREGSKLLPFTLDSRISVYQAEDRWTISNRFRSLSINYLPLQGFGTELRVVTDAGQASKVEGWIEDFELYNLRVLDEQLIPAKIVDTLIQSELHGQLNNVWFSLEPGNISSLRFMAEAVNITSEPVNGIPGINRIDGNLVFGNQNAGLDVGSSQMSLDFADQFPAPLEIDRFKLKADISLLEKGLLLSVPVFEAVNSDIKAFGRLWLESDKAARPFLYLRANLEDGDGSRAPKYLPLKLLPEKIVNWVNRGIRKVDISNGNLLFHGRLEHIQSLEQDRSGEMMVDFEVDNTEILFDSKWKPAQKGKGRVLFHNVGVKIDLERVSFDSIDNASATISIADFKNALIEVDVNTSTSTNSALQTWIGSPVGRKYSSVVKELRNAEGSVIAKIAISLPIGIKNASEQVNVNLRFEDAAVEAPAWGLEFSEIDGDLRITGESITGEGIKAFFYQDPVVIDVSTDQKNTQTIIHANGLLDSRQVLVLLPDYLTQGFAGSSQWDIKVGIANAQPNKAKPTVQINAKSELENTEVFFPEPFSKPANASRPTTINVSIFEGDSVGFEVDYGSDVKARGQLKLGAGKDYRLSMLGLGFSTSPRPLSSTGINIYGSLPRLPLDEWVDYYRARIESYDTSPDEILSLVDMVDLDIYTTLFYGGEITDTDFVMTRAMNGFTGTIESSLLKGNFSLPLKDSPQNPIVADLEYIKFQPGDSESQSTGMLPENFFNLNLYSKVMSYGHFLVSDFRIDTRVEDDQLTVDRLAFRRDKVFLTSTANWQYLPAIKQHRSALNLSITGKQIGQTVSALGLGDTMQDGEINMDGQIRWSGELLHMDWDGLTGDARLEITDGVLKNIDPGSGRFVGLFSLSALPRRFALDFKDVLLEGMKFDKISGTYKIEGENMYTVNTKMEGASAKVKISGRIGLRQRDYDQTMLVIPKIRQTLPLIGGLAAGSTIGWGLLILQNLFKKAIDKTVEVEYKVTGSWDNPQVDLVKKVVIKREMKIK